MKLYLSSYKLGNRTEVLKEWFGEHGNRIALIPNSRDCYPDSDRKTAGIIDDVSALEKIGFDVTILDLREFFKDQDSLVDYAQQFRAYFAIGGNTFVLRKAMELSGFDEYVKSLSYADDVLYGGYSAGICVLAPSLRGLEFVDDPISNPYNSTVDYTGLGIIDYLPVPHYRSDHPESADMENVVSYLKINNLKYKTLRDGDVIIGDTCPKTSEQK